MEPAYILIYKHLIIHHCVSLPIPNPTKMLPFMVGWAMPTIALAKLNHKSCCHFDYNMQSALIQGCKIQSNVSSIDFNSSCTHFATGGRDCTLAAIQPSRYFSLNCRTNAGSSARRPLESTKAPASPKPV